MYRRRKYISMAFFWHMIDSYIQMKFLFKEKISGLQLVAGAELALLRVLQQITENDECHFCKRPIFIRS